MVNVRKLFEGRTVSNSVFPELYARFKEQDQTVLNYYKQNHELYVYGLYSKTPLSNKIAATVNESNGFYCGVLPLSSVKKNIAIKQSNSNTDYDAFYETLLHVPVPFVFVTNNQLNFKGLASIENVSELFDGKFTNGMLLDAAYAMTVGIDFRAGNILLETSAEHFYIGLIYNKNDLQ